MPADFRSFVTLWSFQERNTPRLSLNIIDNLFNADHSKWSLRFTVINLTNKMMLYNFPSTFSGTHYVTPRTDTVELGFHF